MKRFLLLLSCLLLGPFLVPATPAAEPASPPAQVQVAPASRGAADQNVAPAAAEEAAALPARDEGRPPDFLEHMVDVILGLFNVRSSGNTMTHYVISALLLLCGVLARHIVTGIIFVGLKKLASKTETTLDDKLFPAMESPTAAFVMVTGIFAALKVLKLSAQTDLFISYGSRVAFSLAIFWGLWRAFHAILDHAQEVAHERQMGVAAFMPWIRKTLITMFVILGVLLTAQSLGFEVRAFLAGLGIGGLAFALAAQDTIANLFGSIVVAIDQPFKLGQTVKVGAHTGTVEDIGLRSTKIRLIDKSLAVIPNKTVASEAIVNLSRFTQRRVEQVINLTYDTTPEQMEAIVEEIRQIILREAEVDPASVMVYFRDYSASSLDIWIVYASKAADFQPGMQLRQRINLGIMRAVLGRGLSFAFPTQTMHLPDEMARRLAGPGPGRGA